MAEKHEQACQAYADYQNGMKYKDIAAKHGVSVDTVKNWKRRYWVKRDTKEGVKEGVKKGVNADTKKVSQGKKVSQDKNQEKIDEKLLASVEQNEQLNDKQKLFCLCYIKNFNATQAAINAGYTDNYPSEIGYQLLQKTTVRNEIQHLKSIRSQSLMLTQDDIVERYMRIAFADMTDFADWGREQQPVITMNGLVMLKDEKTGEETPMMQEVNTLRFRESCMVDGGLVSQIKQGKDGFSIKLEDRQKALDWLARYFLMNPLDRHKMDYDNARLALEQKKADNSPSDMTFDITVNYGRETDGGEDENHR